jgi:hypothetical protein
VRASRQARKVSVSLFLFSSLLLTNLQLQWAFGADTTPKVHKTCIKEKSKANIGSLTVLCTRIDSKLSWQPSVAQIQLNIWRDLRAQKASLPDAPPALDVFLSPTINLVSANQILDSLNQAAKLWQTEYLPPQALPTLFFTEQDRNWAIEKFADLGLSANGFSSTFDDEVKRNGNRSNWAGVTGENGKIWMSFMVGSEKIPDANDFQVAAHEYTHLAQFNIASSGMSELSCWQVEGGANFYGLYLGASNESQLRTFIKERNTQPFFLGFSGLYKQSSKNWVNLIDKFGPNYDSLKCGPDGAYPVGSVMHEYLYLLKGHAGIIKMIKSVAAEKDFQKGVEKVYGKKWIVLKSDLAKYLKTLVAQST